MVIFFKFLVVGIVFSSLGLLALSYILKEKE